MNLMNASLGIYKMEDFRGGELIQPERIEPPYIAPGNLKEETVQNIVNYLESKRKN